MAPKSPSLRVLAAWLVGIPTLLLAVWFSGHLYWQVRIGRAIAALESSGSDYELFRIGSRGISRLIDELEGALRRGDDRQAGALTRILPHLIARCHEVGMLENPRASNDQSRVQTRLEMKKLVSEWRNMPPQDRENFPPWWMWWKGRLN